MKAQHLCVFHVATGGLSGSLLGADEQEIVLLVYAVIDVNVNKVIGVKHIFVKPNTVDMNENHTNALYGGETQKQTQYKKRVPLSVALKEFDEFVRCLKISTNAEHFHLITDGQLPLRQCVHPEAFKKNIDLPQYYNQFHDLRKHFQFFYHVSNEEILISVSDLLNHISMPFDEDSHNYFGNEMCKTVSDVQKMVALVQKLIVDEHNFASPEKVNLSFESKLFSKDESINDEDDVLELRCSTSRYLSELDVVNFFRGLNLAKVYITAARSVNSRDNHHVVAKVQFIDKQHRDMALKRNNHHIGSHCIEVCKSSRTDILNVVGDRNNQVHNFLMKGAEAIIKMVGLPYECSVDQIVNFFSLGTDVASNVMDGKDGVLMVKKYNGKNNGVAYVLFKKKEDAAKALRKDREKIGNRYVELFTVSAAEVRQGVIKATIYKSVTNKSNNFDPQKQVFPPKLSLQTLLKESFHAVSKNLQRDMIFLKGLPFQTCIEHIGNFLGAYLNNVAFQGVHMIYVRDVPTGEACIQMDSERSAFLTSQAKHNRPMKFEENHYNVLVFQCSKWDMIHLLTCHASPFTSLSVTPVDQTFSLDSMPPYLPKLSPISQSHSSFSSLNPFENTQLSQYLAPSDPSFNVYMLKLSLAQSYSPNSRMSLPLTPSQMITAITHPQPCAVSSYPQPNNPPPPRHPVLFPNVGFNHSNTLLYQNQSSPVAFVPVEPTLYTMPPLASLGIQRLHPTNVRGMKRRRDEDFQTMSKAVPFKVANTEKDFC